MDKDRPEAAGEAGIAPQEENYIVASARVWEETAWAELMHDEFDSIKADGGGDIREEVRTGQWGAERRRLLALYPTRESIKTYRRLFFADAVLEMEERRLEQNIKDTLTPAYVRVLGKELDGVRQGRQELRLQRAAAVEAAEQPERVVNADLWDQPEGGARA